MSKETIAIAGLGWLGLPLATYLNMAGYTIKGSVTSLEKAKKLQDSGVDAYAVQLNETGVSGAPQALLKHADYLIIAIPPVVVPKIIVVIIAAVTEAKTICRPPT